MLAIHIDAGHSSNGNPRRGFIIADDNGNFVDFVDESFIGRSALAQAGYASIASTASRIEVPAKVYSEFKRDAEHTKQKLGTRAWRSRRS
jgi:hypothetical protein